MTILDYRMTILDFRVAILDSRMIHIDYNRSIWRECIYDTWLHMYDYILPKLSYGGAAAPNLI